MAGPLFRRTIISVTQRAPNHNAAAWRRCEISMPISLERIHGIEIFAATFHADSAKSIQRPGPGCSSSRKSLKVAVLGAGSQTGRIMSLCVKQSPIIDELAVFDHCSARGVMYDLSLMTTRCRTFYVPEDEATGEAGLERALTNAKIVFIVSDCIPLRCYVDNVQHYTYRILEYCPKAFVAVVTSRTNTLIPMMFEIYKKAGWYEYGNRIFGVTSLYSTRANTYAAQVLGVKPEFVKVPVIGGADARTVVPLFSQAQPCAKYTSEELTKLQAAMKHAEDQVCTAYRSMNADMDKQASSICAGYSAARFCNSLCKETGVVECAYTRSNLLPDVKYLGAPLELGTCGIQRHLGVSRLTSSECRTLTSVLPEIKAAIEEGECLALGAKPQKETCQVTDVAETTSSST